MVRLTLLRPGVDHSTRHLTTAAVLVWTIICLALAVHLKGILVSSDLSEFPPPFSSDDPLIHCPIARFIPFAIFVCCASLLLVMAL